MSDVVKGLIGDSLTTKFIEDMKSIVERIPVKIWAYYADQSDCQGFTPHSENNLIESNKHSIQSGCVVDAYLSGSALALDQVAKTRVKAGVPVDIQDRIFDTESEAKAFLQKALQKAYQKTGDST